jgi:hypothetical protein
LYISMTRAKSSNPLPISSFKTIDNLDAQKLNHMVAVIFTQF